MKHGLRKLVLTVHLTCSIGWIGAVVAYLTIVIAARANPDAETLRTAWGVLWLIGWFTIVPSALASLTTGIIMALGTKWGLFQHYWVLISLVLTLIATAILLQHMGTVNTFAGIAARATHADNGTLRDGLAGELLHGGIGLLVLLVIQVLNVYKPRGITTYGWKKQQAGRRLDSLT